MSAGSNGDASGLGSTEGVVGGVRPQVSDNTAHTPGVRVTETPLPGTDGRAYSAAPAGAAAANPASTRGDDQEVVYYEGSPLLRGKSKELFTFGLIGLLLIFAPFLVRTFLPSIHLPRYVTIALIAVGAILMLIPYLLTKSISYRVTNYRVDFERGLLAKSIDTIELWHIEDLKFHQTLFDRLLRVGSIQIVVRDPANPRLVLNSLPNARTLFETLKQRVITVKRQPGVVKIDSGTLAS